MNINSIYAADFETTTAAPTRVWSWQIRNVGTSEIHSQGTHIEDFMTSAPPATMFFHNLAFDGSFILDWALRNGFKWVNLDRSPKGRADGLDRVYKGQISAIISDMGQFYEVRFNNGNGEVVIQDSLKKVPGTLRELGIAYGANVLKGTTPLHAKLPEDYEPTPAEWAYLDNDTEILAHVLRVVIGEGHTSMTIGGDCFRTWRKMLQDDHALMVPRPDGEGEKKESPTEVFRRIFPVLNRKDDERIRLAYRGGWTYVKPSIQGQVLTEGGVVFDVNSMYPSVQVQELFPVGFPKKLQPGEAAPDTHPLTITGKCITFTLKEDHLPIIPENAVSFGVSGWATEGECVEVWATNQEWKLFEDHYHLDVEYELGGYAFRAESGDSLFGTYIRFFMAIKETTKGAKRLLAKLFLNNLWGKFGTNPKRGKRFPTLENQEDAVGMVAGTVEYTDPVFTPVAVFTTAYARERIVRSAQANYARFCYADTDSLHMTGTDTPEGLEVHDSKLGAWAHEGTWTEAVYCRAKAYVERMDTVEENLLPDPETGERRIAVAMAGLPAEAREGLSPETVFDGQEFGGKLARKRVVGGLILAPVAWKLDYRHGIRVL